MLFLDSPFERYPKTWGEMSYDFKLMFLYHGSMMLLMVAGLMLSIGTEVIIAGVLLTAAIVLSIRHRRTTSWVWPGVSSSRLLGAAATLLLGGLFLLAALPLFPPTNATVLPWYLAGAGIIFFATLNSLRFVALAEADYHDPPSPPRRSAELPWKKIVRLVYSFIFLIVWLESVASFYYFGITFRDGSDIPTVTQTEPLREHGKVVYVNPSQKRLVDALHMAMFIGIPSVMILGAIIHFIIGIKLFPNVSTLEQR